jgi:hypothetical protein
MTEGLRTWLSVTTVTAQHASCTGRGGKPGLPRISKRSAFGLTALIPGALLAPVPLLPEPQRPTDAMP